MPTQQPKSNSAVVITIALTAVGVVVDYLINVAAGSAPQWVKTYLFPGLILAAWIGAMLYLLLNSHIAGRGRIARWGTAVALVAFLVSLFLVPQLSGSTAMTNGAPTPTATTGPTPLPTATPVPPQVIAENREIPCVYTLLNCSVCPTKLVLDTVTIDTAHQRMLWKFTITNTSTYASCSYYFSKLELEDPATRTYDATGQAHDTWNLGPGASIDETPTFTFIPERGVEYKLLLQLDGDRDFQTEAFTF